MGISRVGMHILTTNGICRQPLLSSRDRRLAQCVAEYTRVAYLLPKLFVSTAEPNVPVNDLIRDVHSCPRFRLGSSVRFGVDRVLVNALVALPFPCDQTPVQLPAPEESEAVTATVICQVRLVVTTNLGRHAAGQSHPFAKDNLAHTRM